MKKHIGIFAFIFVLLFSMVSFAGEWKQDDIGWWYQNDDGGYPVSTWMEIDGKQYYFGEDGYMLANTTTPDGYRVGVDGAWQEEEVYMFEGVEYDNKVDFEIINPSGSSRPGAEKNILPVTVYYNDEYENVYGGRIRVSNIELRENRDVYMTFDVDEEGGSYKFLENTRYHYADGTYHDETRDVVKIDVRGPRKDISRKFVPYGSNKPVSAEVTINAGKLENNRIK